MILITYKSVAHPSAQRRPARLPTRPRSPHTAPAWPGPPPGQITRSSARSVSLTIRRAVANPRVRVIARPARLRDGLRTRSRAGTAHLMPDDDAHARHRLLGRGRPLYRLDGIALRRLADGGDMLTIRIDLD